MITKILFKPVSIAQHVVGGVARGGLHGAVAVARRILPGDQDDNRPVDESPRVSTEPVHQPPSPTTTTKRATTNTMPAKKARAERAAKKPSAAKTSTPKKPASVLDDGPAPVDDDPVVYSTGPDVTTHVAEDDLDDLRP